MYLLDTNIISEIRRAKFGKCNQGVIDWFAAVPPNQVYTSVVVLMELERGILSMERRDPTQGKVLRRWFEEQVKPGFANKIMMVDEFTATLCANLHIPDRSPENDAWIAATALRYNLTLVTRNTKDFEKMKVKVLNPFVE